MKTGAIAALLTAGLAAAAVCGCAGPVNKNLRQEAQALTVSQVAADPGAHNGAMVIWGGTITKVDAFNGGTIYIQPTPLGWREKPAKSAEAKGGFIAHGGGLLDIAQYHPGELLTVAGTVSGARVEADPVEKTDYTYPIVEVDAIHAWRRSPCPYACPDWLVIFRDPSWTCMDTASVRYAR